MEFEVNLSDDELKLRLELYQKHGSYVAAADELGMNETAFRRSVKQAVRRNLGGTFLGGTAPEGYTIGKVTRLVGANGKSQLEWQHTHPDVAKVQEYIDQMLEAMATEIDAIPAIEPPDYDTINPDWLTLYPVVDVHLGLYAWSKETGASYDLDIAKDQFLHSTAELFSLSPNSEEALIVVLGDFFHADNNNAQTEKSHNHLDVDGRHDKVLHLGAELIMWMIEQALHKHHKVTVRVMRGNHDPYASKALTLGLYLRYLGNKRVTVERSAMDLWVFQFGKNMLGFTHGDNVKAQDMPGVMAAYYPQMWGETAYRYAYSGHFHKSKKATEGDERHGAQYEILPAFTAKDAWTRSMGHSSMRSIMSKTYDRNTGLKFTTTVQV